MRVDPATDYDSRATEVTNVIWIEHDSAARGNHEVLLGSQLAYEFAFVLAKELFAFLFKDFGDGLVVPLFKNLVHVDELHAEPVGGKFAGRSFAAGHESDKDKIFHRTNQLSRL